MKTNTNTELREKIADVFDAHYSDRPVNGHWLLYEDVLTPLVALIDQYVHQRIIDELKHHTKKRKHWKEDEDKAEQIKGWNGHINKLEERIAYLQASLNTEGENR